MRVPSSKLNGFLREFVEKREQQKQPEHFIAGYHPKNGLPKKATSFYPGCCHVRFDRKGLPKSGKSIYKTCFIDSVNGIQRAWDRDTRALLLVSTKELDMDVLDQLIEQFKEIRNEFKR